MKRFLILRVVMLVLLFCMSMFCVPLSPVCINVHLTSYVLGKQLIDYAMSVLMPLMDLQASLSVAKWVWAFMMDYKDVIEMW